MSLTSSKANDGQHRQYGSGAPGQSAGQRGVLDPGVSVGQRSGGEMNMSIPTTRKDADISTTTGSAGPLTPGETGGADDKR
jgi:hypothetical protein